MIDTPVKKIGMENVELMKFFQNFPAGSETLVLRIIHILTEKCMQTTVIFYFSLTINIIYYFSVFINFLDGLII